MRGAGRAPQAAQARPQAALTRSGTPSTSNSEPAGRGITLNERAGGAALQHADGAVLRLLPARAARAVAAKATCGRRRLPAWQASYTRFHPLTYFPKRLQCSLKFADLGACDCELQAPGSRGRHGCSILQFSGIDWTNDAC